MKSPFNSSDSTPPVFHAPNTPSAGGSGAHGKPRLQKQPRSKVILIGAGPGDPEFLTLRAYNRLQTADVVLHDALLTDSLLELIPAKAEKVYVGKRGGFKHASQAEINELLVQKAQGGKIVVRLKGGDPYIYGRGAEEAQYCLDHGLEVEVIPGLSSALSVPALAGIPVLHRELAGTVMILHGRLLPPSEEELSKVATLDESEPVSPKPIIIKTHKTPIKEKCPDTRKSVNWRAIAQAADTLVFLMFLDNSEAIQQGLLYGGRSPKQLVAGIRWGATAQQFTVTSTIENFVQDFQAASLGSPSVMVVGDVVQFAERLNFYEKRPLVGAQIVFTFRPQEKGLYRESLEELGATFRQIPVLDVPKLAQSPDQQRHLAQEMQHVTHFLITKPELAEVFETALERSGFNAEHLLRTTPIICPTPAVEKLVLECGLTAIRLPLPVNQAALEHALGRSLADVRLIVLEGADEWNDLTEELDALGVHQTTLPLKAFDVEGESLIKVENALQTRSGRTVLVWESEAAVRAVLNHFGSAARLALKPVIHLCLQPGCLETLQHNEMPFVAELRSLQAESVVQALDCFRPLNEFPADATSFPG
ncbi:MAG: uroporphyrinogen-III C-methyltransferase [Sumerlaeia bacterium]